MAEDRLLQVIMGHFGLSWPMPAEVKRADDQLLLTEARDLMSGEVWFMGDDIRPLPQAIVPWDWQTAERAFLARFAELRESGRGLM